MNKEVNVMQHINLVVAFGTLLAVGDSMREMGGLFVHWRLWCFALFFCLLRFKMFADDHGTFAITRNDRNFRINFLLAVIIWLTYYAAAHSLAHLKEACVWMIIGMSIAASAMIVDLRIGRLHDEQKYWLFCDTVYIVLFTYITLRQPPYNPLMDCAIFGVFAVLLTRDYIKSKSFDNLT